MTGTSGTTTVVLAEVVAGGTGSTPGIDGGAEIVDGVSHDAGGTVKGPDHRAKRIVMIHASVEATIGGALTSPSGCREWFRGRGSRGMLRPASSFAMCATRT